jgi:hypothetical protein
VNRNEVDCNGSRVDNCIGVVGDNWKMHDVCDE